MVEVANSMDTEKEMVVKRLSVPLGLEELMESLTKEVLRKKPNDIYNFASEHFAQLLAFRDGCNKNPRNKTSQTSKQNMEVNYVKRRPPIKIKSATMGMRISKPIVPTSTSSINNITKSQNERSDKTKSILNKRKVQNLTGNPRETIQGKTMKIKNIRRNGTSLQSNTGSFLKDEGKELDQNRKNGFKKMLNLKMAENFPIGKALTIGKKTDVKGNKKSKDKALPGNKDNPPISKEYKKIDEEVKDSVSENENKISMKTILDNNEKLTNETEYKQKDINKLSSREKINQIDTKKDEKIENYKKKEEFKIEEEVTQTNINKDENIENHNKKEEFKVEEEVNQTDINRDENIENHNKKLDFKVEDDNISIVTDANEMNESQNIKEEISQNKTTITDSSESNTSLKLNDLSDNQINDNKKAIDVDQPDKKEKFENVDYESSDHKRSENHAIPGKPTLVEKTKNDLQTNLKGEDHSLDNQDVIDGNIFTRDKEMTNDKTDSNNIENSIKIEEPKENIQIEQNVQPISVVLNKKSENKMPLSEVEEQTPTEDRGDRNSQINLKTEDHRIKETNMKTEIDHADEENYTKNKKQKDVEENEGHEIILRAVEESDKTAMEKEKYVTGDKINLETESFVDLNINKEDQNLKETTIEHGNINEALNEANIKNKEQEDVSNEAEQREVENTDKTKEENYKIDNNDHNSNLKIEERNDLSTKENAHKLKEFDNKTIITKNENFNEQSMETDMKNEEQNGKPTKTHEIKLEGNEILKIVDEKTVAVKELIDQNEQIGDKNVENISDLKVNGINTTKIPKEINLAEEKGLKDQINTNGKEIDANQQKEILEDDEEKQVTENIDETKDLINDKNNQECKSNTPSTSSIVEDDLNNVNIDAQKMELVVNSNEEITTDKIYKEELKNINSGKLKTESTNLELDQQNQETVEFSQESLNNEKAITTLSQMIENTKKENGVSSPRKMLKETTDTEKTKEFENKNNVTEEEIRCKNETKESINNDSKMNNDETGTEPTGDEIKAAVKIQSVIRGYLARNNFKKLLKKNEFVSKIDQQFETQVGTDQRNSKNTSFKREIAKYKNLTKMFVINEQNSYQSERNDKLGNTIRTTENNLFGKQVKVVAPTVEKLTLTPNANDAALKIQSVWRGHKTRKSLKDLELKTLQARTECDELPEQRGLLSRADTVKAAIVIQALFRDYVVRKHNENTILRKKKSLEEKLLTVPEDKENILEENEKINKIADSDIFDALKQLDEAPIPPNSPKVEDAGVKLTRGSTVEESVIESKHFSPLTRSVSADDYSHKGIDLLEKFDESLSKRDESLVDLTKSIEDLTNIIHNETVLEKIDDVKGNVKKSEDYEPTSNAERQSVDTNKISDEETQKIEEIKDANVSKCSEKIEDSDVKFEGSIDDTKKSERKDENEIKEKSHPKTLNEDLNEIEEKGDLNVAFRTENVANDDAVNKENLYEVKENNISEKTNEISNLSKMKEETEEKSQIEEIKKIESGLAENNDKETTHQNETDSDRTHSENLEKFPQEISEKNDEKCADEGNLREETDNKIKENVNQNVDSKDLNDVNLDIKDNLKVSRDKNDKNEETKKDEKFALNLPNDKTKFSDIGNVGNEEKPNKNLTSIIEEVDLETHIIENTAQEENAKNKSFSEYTNNQILHAKEETVNSKSKQIVLDPIQENLFDQEAAATTIQKNYRGYRARKKQHKINDDTTKNNTIKLIVDEDKSEGNANNKESSKTTEDFSNNKIEAIKTEQFEDANLNTATSKMINSDDDKIADPNVAATTIQKNYKGYRARRDLKKVKEDKNMDLSDRKINSKDVTVEKIQKGDNQKMIVKKEGDDPTMTERLLQEKNETDKFVSKTEDQDLNKTGFLKSNKDEEAKESSNDKDKKHSDLVVGNDVCNQDKKVEEEIDKANIYKMENTTLKKMEEICKIPLLSENKLDNKYKGINDGIINKETAEDNKALVDVNKQMNLIAEIDTNGNNNIIFQKDGMGGCDFKQKVINDKNNDEEPTVKNVEDNKSQLHPENNKLIEEPFVGQSGTVEEKEGKNEDYTKANLNSVTSNVSREQFEEIEASKDTSNNSEISEDEHVDKGKIEGIINKGTIEDNKALEDDNKQMHLFAENDCTSDSDKIIFEKDGKGGCDFKQKVINDKNNDEEPTVKNVEDNKRQLHPENNKLIEEPFVGQSDTVEENEENEESEASKDTSINSEMSDDTRVYIRDLTTSMKEDIHNLKQTLSEDVSVEATQQQTIDGKHVTDLTNSIKNDVLELRKTLLVNNTTNETNEINPIESSTSNKSRTTDRERVNKNTVGSISTPSDLQGEFLNKVTLYTPDAHIDTNPSKRECKENSKQTLQFSNNKQTSPETCGIDTKDELNAETRNKDFNDSIVCESEVFERFSRPVSKESTNSDESADTVIFNEYVEKKTASKEDKLQNVDAKLETEEDLKKHQILEEKSSVVHEGKDNIKYNLDEKAQCVNHIEMQTHNTENNTNKTTNFDKLRSEEIAPKRKIEAATIIQKNYRGYLARKNLNNTEENFKKKTNGNEITKYLESITEPIRRAFSAEETFKNKTDGSPLTHKEENEPKSIYIPLRNYGSEELTPNDGLEHTNYKNDDKVLIHKTKSVDNSSLVDKGTKTDNSPNLTLKKDKENNDKETNLIQHEENLTLTDANFAIPSITEESDTTELMDLEKLSKSVDMNETTKENVNNLDTKLEKTIEKIDEEITSYLNSIIEPVKQAFAPIKNENTHEISHVIEEPESVYIPLKDYDKFEESELEKEDHRAPLNNENNMDFNIKFIGKNEENNGTPHTNQGHITKDTSTKEIKIEKNDERNMETINTCSENEQQKSENESEINQNKDLQVEEENSINQNEELSNLKKEITTSKLPFKNSQIAEKEISNYVKAIVDPIKKTFSPHKDSSEGLKGPANENQQETSIYIPLKDYSLDDNKQVMEIKNDLSHDMDKKIKEEENLKQLEENDVKMYGENMYRSEEDMTIEKLKRDDNFDILSKENTPKIDQNIIHVKNVETELNHGNGENTQEFVGDNNGRRVVQKTKESSVDQNEESINLKEETADKKQQQLLNQPYKDLTIVEEEISNYINTIVDPLKKTFSPYKTKDSIGQEIPDTENNQKTSVYIPLKDYNLDERKEEMEMKNNAEANIEDTNEDNLKKLQEIDAKRELKKNIDPNEENGNKTENVQTDNFELESVENNQKNDQNTGELRNFENEETKDVTKGNKISDGEENVKNNIANPTIISNKKNLLNNHKNVDNVEKMIANEQLNDQENVEKDDRKDHLILDIQERDNLTANQEDRNNHNLKHEPFYLHRDKFYETQVVSQEKAFSEAIKGGRAKKEEMKKEEGLLHSSEFHDGVPVTNKRQTEATTAQNSSTATPTVLIHSGELHDNVIPLALQMNDAPAGAEIVTSTRRPNGEAHASNKVVLARSNTQNAPQIDRNGGMDAEKRNNCTIAKKKNMEIEAATKIQAGFRGYQVRKQLKKKNSSGSKSSIRRSSRRKSSGRLSDSIKSSQKKKPSQLEEQSATKIQAGIRGFLVRRRQKKNNSTTNETV